MDTISRKEEVTHGIRVKSSTHFKFLIFSNVYFLGRLAIVAVGMIGASWCFYSIQLPNALDAYELDCRWCPTRMKAPLWSMHWDKIKSLGPIHRSIII